MRVAQSIERKLTEALKPDKLEITDESARHEGHAGARPEGESHFHVMIVSAEFDGKSRLERQRLVYRVLADDMKSDIHALALTCQAPGEA
ncbi:MAG: BolA family transcriptional regulator [Rhodospirillaceae bacterium]|jgi:BolA family transcriptional regulator, general stress-responsive regulator|nr:BolA family transcriptional regulator [Rhodospirillaceae bacterium]MBT3927844.1 BolA family transcriptional regulator [Rhodospirillaceae bacterium]MBT4426895.1 BolA family transcriptional regulator [Rhodospirillaceae bacterium]MBT5037433.1 BolA family transcriptional regulator [Rhodospirillaceae bacterium]MBT5677617.1 BolA family transcriptional regulator [Rhodospirillaceae bacterium]